MYARENQLAGNMVKKKRLLFLPVSSSEGIGEYIRSLNFALSLEKSLPGLLEFHFVLNKNTAYAKSCPFPVTLVEQTPTKEVTIVNGLIENFQPDIVIFDCSGRASQMKKAKEVGACVIFVSQHAKKRAKGLKLNRLNLIDIHWVVQPSYCIDELSFIEKLKLKCFSLATPKNIGSFFIKESIHDAQKLITKHALTQQQYFVVNAGSGGHYNEGTLCADTFYKAAEKITEITGLKAVVVFGANYPNALPQSEKLLVLESLQVHEFITLVSQSKFAVLSAGDTLLQAIELKVPTIGVSISKDQPQRLDRCVESGLVVPANAKVNELVNKAQQLLQPETFCHLQHKLAGVPVFNAHEQMLHDITRLVRK